LVIPEFNTNKNVSVCTLASGSKGNSVYISNGSTSILIDAGFSGIEIEKRLKSKGLDPKNLDAIIVSHEHSDHIRGVGVLSRRFDIPVYMNRKTDNASAAQTGNIQKKYYFNCGVSFQINSLSIHPFSTSHDAAESACFTISHDNIKIGIATDMGMATAMVKQHLKGCSLLILEANHDLEMLTNGTYPWHLKQRIKSRTGHLSNVDAKNLLSEVAHNQLKHVILAHLSEENNLPEKATRVVGEAITQYNINLYPARQDRPSDIFHL
jgi:phosphoribosyl 1,2-cyclic phosphodiesterase